MPSLISDEERATVLQNWDTLSAERRQKMERLGVKPEVEQTSPLAPLKEPVVDLRKSSPWYQEAFKRFKLPGSWEEFGKTMGTVAEGNWEGYTPEQGNKDLRRALEVVPPVLAAGLTGIPPGPASIPVAVQMAKGPLWNLWQNLSPWLYRAGLTGGVAGAGAAAANIVDPEHYTDPVKHALWTGGGQAVGEIGGSVADKGIAKTGQIASRFLGDTPQGTTMRTTIESRGGEAPVGITTKSGPLASMSELLEHMPGGAQLRHIKDKAQQLIDDALQTY